jgi:hypothetical protein
MKLTDEQIGAELRALRQTASERFAAELDARASTGFPPEESDGDWGILSRLRRRATSVPPRRLVPVMGAAATLVVVAGVAVSQVAIDRADQPTPQPAPQPASLSPEEDQPGRTSLRGAPTEQAPPATSVAPTTRAPDVAVPPAPPKELKPGKPRVEERSASLTLSADADEVAEVADGVVEVTDRYEGIVVSSNVSSNGDRGRATFNLRIPTANLQAALADFSDLASVSARDEGTLDITAPFVNAEERFTDAKAEVDALLEELADADDATEIAAIREQLRVARSELAAARSELGGLKQRADYSRVALTVTGNGDADGRSLGDAADDAVSVLEDLLGAGLVALAVIVPLGGLALLGWLGWDRARRRRRESALDE